jgi:hypothetical protein
MCIRLPLAYPGDFLEFMPLAEDAAHSGQCFRPYSARQNQQRPEAAAPDGALRPQKLHVMKQ